MSNVTTTEEEDTKVLTTSEEAVVVKDDDDSITPPMDAENLIAGAKLINELRFYNDIAILLVIVFSLLTFVFLLSLVNEQTSKWLKSHELYSLISFLFIIIVLIASFRSSYMNIKHRLEEPPCDTEPPLRIDPSNKVYAVASFIYIYMIIMLRAIVHIAIVFTSLYMFYLMLNRCLLSLGEIRFQPSIWWVFIIPAILWLYQMILGMFFTYYTFLKTYQGLCKFISPSCLLQYTSILDQSDGFNIHKRAFITAIGFATIFGILFINTADKDASCTSKKEKEKYTVFKNRTLLGIVVVITLMLMVYLGLWIKMLSIKLVK